MKIGINLKIDVTKIDKSKMFKGAKSVYLDCTAFVDIDNPDQHGNNGMITQAWKDQQKGQGPVLGNAKVFWRDGQGGQGSQNSKPAQNKAQIDFDDDSLAF